MILLGRKRVRPHFTHPGATLAATTGAAVLADTATSARLTTTTTTAAAIAVAASAAALDRIASVVTLARPITSAAWRFLDMPDWKAGDTYPPADITLTDDGNPVDVTDATAIKFYAETKRLPSGASTKPTISGTCTAIDAASGQVRYEWAAGDLVAGDWIAEVEVTWTDGGIQTFPPGGYLEFSVKADLDS